MVILIGGASCTGKTVMAQRLLEKYHIPYLSIDHIKMGLFRSGMDYGFTPNDDEDELTVKLWPVVRGIIMTNIENGQHIVIEGCYLPQARIRELEPEYLKQIIPLYIGFSENYIINKFELGILGHQSEIERKENDGYINKENLLCFHKRTKQRCKDNDIMYFEINEDYKNEMKRAYSWIDMQMQAICSS